MDKYHLIRFTSVISGIICFSMIIMQCVGTITLSTLTYLVTCVSFAILICCELSLYDYRDGLNVYVVGSFNTLDDVKLYSEKMIKKYGRNHVRYLKESIIKHDNSIEIEKIYDDIDWADTIYLIQPFDMPMDVDMKYIVTYIKQSYQEKTIVEVDPEGVISTYSCLKCGYKMKRPLYFTYESDYNNSKMGNRVYISNKNMILARPHYYCNFCHNKWEGPSIIVRDRHGDDIISNIEFIKNTYRPLDDFNLRLDINVLSSYKKEVFVIVDNFKDYVDFNRIVSNRYSRPYFFNILDPSNDHYADINTTYKLIRECDKIIVFYYDDLINNVNMQYVKSYANKFNKTIIEVPDNPFSDISGFCPKCMQYNEPLTSPTSISFRRIIDKPGVTRRDKNKKRCAVYVVPTHKCTNPKCGYTWYAWNKAFPVTDENGDDCSEILEYFITHK